MVLSRYKPSTNGTLLIDNPQPGTGGSPATRGVTREGTGGGSKSGKIGPVGGVYSAFLKNDGSAGVQVKPDPFPHVKWISTSDGTRLTGDIEDKAARYLPDLHMLLINTDFRVFADMVQYWSERYGKEHGETTGLRDIVADSVHDWYEQALVETVIGVQALKGSREWSIKQIEQALSEEALTAVVMQRYHPYNSVKRELGTKIAPLKK